MPNPRRQPLLNTYNAIVKLVADVLGERVVAVETVEGKGIVNEIYFVRTPDRDVVVRMNRERDALPVYMKEWWCLDQASRHGVPGPRVLAVGESGEHAYMLQTRLPGDNGEDSMIDPLHIWHALGQYARIIHAIPVTGFGEDLVDFERGVFESPKHANYNGTWPDFIRYNIDSLTHDDPLIGLGVLRPADRDRVKDRFAELRERTFRFGLNHGDLSLKNTVVDPRGAVGLLDWGSAAVHIVPHWDLIEVVLTHGDDGWTQPPLAAFLEGYQMPASELDALKEELDTLMLLRSFDTLRWAIDRHPPSIPRCASRARRMLRRTFQRH